MNEKEAFPPPKDDWIDQANLAKLFGISERTASTWASAGRLHPFEHGVATCGRKKYSRQLVERELQHRWEQAIQAQNTFGQVTRRPHHSEFDITDVQSVDSGQGRPHPYQRSAEHDRRYLPE